MAETSTPGQRGGSATGFILPPERMRKKKLDKYIKHWVFKILLMR